MEEHSHIKRNIGVVVETESPAERAGIVLENWFEHAQHTPLLFLTAGGSSLEVLDHITPELCGSHMTVCVLDERFSTEASVNNFLQLQETRFMRDVIEAGVQVINTVPREGESLGMLAERFAEALREWRAQNPEGIVIALMGMGPDGHTAGIFPYTEKEAEAYGALFESDAWVAGYDAGDKHEHALRVTTTNTFLKQEVDQALLFVTGEAKREALGEALDMHGERFEIPTRVIHDMRNVTIVTNIPIDGGEDASLVVNQE